MTSLLEMFSPLKNPAFFKNVQVEKGGYAVYWSDEIDIKTWAIPTLQLEGN